MAITLEEALRQGKVKIGDYVDYKPISGRCVLTQEQTGWNEFDGKQAFETENLGWKFDKIDGDLVLIASRPTRLLYLKGKTGYNNGIGAMKTLCESCYSNPRFSQKAVPITEELQQKMRGRHIIDAAYWLGTSVFGICSSLLVTYVPYTYYSMGYFDEDKVKYVRLYRSNSGSGYDFHGVRPIVYLKPEIQLEGDLDTKKGPWRILPPQD